MISPVTVYTDIASLTTVEQHKNPTPTVDIIIEDDSRILLIKRKNEPFKDHLVLPGGFVNEGKKVEDAAKREGKKVEETSLDVDLIDILGFYSDRTRDPRGHNMSTRKLTRTSINNLVTVFSGIATVTMKDGPLFL
jgi:ADP-ribose pyrophosphatase YjhB (NUDIX family)